MTSNAFSLFDKKQLKSKIHLMSWSPKRDLIAMATDIGELLLYRLSALERAWVLPPHSSGTLINTICWRPDGNVVAVGHSTKEAGVRFVYMEKAEIVWHLNNEKSLLEQPASILKWFEHSEYVTESPVSENISSLSAKDYIPELPKLPSKELQTVNVQSIVGASRFHILILCDVHNNVTLLAYGVFPILTISASTFSLEKSLPVKITDLCLTPNFKEVIFTISLENKPTSASCIAQVVKIPSKYHDITMWDHAAQTACHLTTTLSYMSNVLECMNESCDTVIQEMETKLTCYLINKPISGTIGDELLHFLLWGKSSDVIRDFLMKCITEKGVVKLKKFVESSYTYMLQLLLINFQMAADAIYYHVVEIKGMEKPAVIGGINLFDFNLVQEALESAGSFILKARELQHVVERSQKNFLAFFRFLHYSWLKVQDEPVDESSQMSSQELEFVADFITDSLIHEHEQLKASGKEKHFNFDKVYQYFQDAPLTSCLETEKNSWHHLVESTSTLSDNPLIIKQRPNNSFRQLFLGLRKKLQTLLNFPSLTLNEKNIQQKVEISSCLKPFPQQSCIWHKQAKTDVSTYILSTLSKPPHQKISFVKINPGRCRQIHLQFSESLSQLAKTDSHYTISDFAFYDEKFVTFLLATDSRCSILAQVSFLDLISEVDERECDPDGGSTASMECVDVSKYVAHYSTIEGMHAIKVASSGTRKVACLLGSDLRVIRTYEMEPSNEDYPDTDVSMNTG